MLSKKQIILFYIICVVFIAVNVYFIAFKNEYYINLIPIALIVFAFLFYPMDKLLLISVFFAPLSVPLSLFIRTKFDLDLPTEPIFIFITALFLLKCIKEKFYDKNFLRHPITLSIFFYILWRIITIPTSTFPLISAKNIIMQLWFIIPFYFLMFLVVNDFKKIKKFLWIYIISCAIVVTYIIIMHTQHSFSKSFSNFAQRPFFSDHTSYGAILAIVIPLLIGFIADKLNKNFIRIISFGLLLLFIFAIITSYTRAAWLSLIVAAGFAIIVKLKLNYKVFITLAVIAIISFFVFQKEIFIALEGNKHQSSENLLKHVKSITNVASDASNKERINRWNCAIRMYKEKPFYGWGAGTYQFNYAPFQYSSEKTIASTNSGDNGNAHSDYLGALAETGFLGMFAYVLIVFSVIIISIKTYNELKSKSLKILLLSLICSLMTYFTHGFLNNFLDKDKIAVPFWSMIAIIVFINIEYKNLEKDEINRIGNK